MARMRSPNYPSLSVRQAIDMVSKIYRTERTNDITREDAAKAMGYAGLTGRSMTVIGALIHFDLLAKTGKGLVKVTATAEAILHGITDAERDEAILKAAFAPQLFQSILNRFPEGIPSTGTIKSFLMREGFSDVAVGPAINAFMETYREVENIRESESHGPEAEEAPESPEQPQETPVNTQPLVATPAVTPATAFTSLAPSDLNQINMDIRGDKVMVSGLLDAKGLAILEKKIAALKVLLAVYTDANDTGEDDGSIPITRINGLN